MLFRFRFFYTTVIDFSQATVSIKIGNFLMFL